MPRKAEPPSVQVQLALMAMFDEDWAVTEAVRAMVAQFRARW